MEWKICHPVTLSTGLRLLCGLYLDHPRAAQISFPMPSLTALFRLSSKNPALQQARTKTHLKEVVVLLLLTHVEASKAVVGIRRDMGVHHIKEDSNAQSMGLINQGLYWQVWEDG